MPLVEWKGDEIVRKVDMAVRVAMDGTMALAVREAKQRVPVRTATLQGSIEMRPTKRAGADWVGRWGSFLVNYAIFVEMGTGRMAAQPYMRPAADHHYPRLAHRLAAAFRAL